MADLNLFTPDAVVPTLLDAFDHLYPGRTEVDEDGTIIELYTKVQWARMKVRDFIREVYKTYKAHLAAEAARKTAIEEADTDTEGVDVT